MNRPILDIHDPLIQAILDARCNEIMNALNQSMGRGWRLRLNPTCLAETDDEKHLAKVLFED